MALPVQINLEEGYEFPSKKKRKIHILKIKNWKDYRTDWNEDCIDTPFGEICTPIPTAQERICELNVYGRVSHPNIDEIISDIEDCIEVSLTAAIITLITAGDLSAASAVLTGSLKLCLTTKGVDRAFDVSISVEKPIKECGEWRSIVR